MAPNAVARVGFDEVPTGGVRTEAVIEYLGTTLVGWLGRRIRVDENFFDAGLNSVLLARLEDSLGERFGLSLPPATLFTYPNLAALAGFLAGCRDQAPDRGPDPHHARVADQQAPTGQTRRDIRASIRRGARGA